MTTPTEQLGSAGVIAAIHETSVSAAAAQAKALVEARFIVALQRPRDMDFVRTKILNECQRLRFAETARYSRPVGGGNRAEGPSIRFAEVAIRHMGNIDVQTPTLFEDDDKRIVRVSVVDLESNSGYATDITIEKTVERRQLKQGQAALSERLNSQGQKVYLVRATEDDMMTKTGALVSKAIRNNGLRLLPGDIQDEAMEKCLETLRNRDAEDPAAARKRVFDAFNAIGVSPADIKRYLGHNDSNVSPAELQDLREVFAAVKDGQVTWHEVIRAREEDEQGQPPEKRDRSKATLDQKDVAKLVEIAEKRAEKLRADTVFANITGEEVLGLFLDAKQRESVHSIPKGDLPGLLKELRAFYPPTDAEG